MKNVYVLYRRHALRASDEEGRVRDDAGSFSRAVRRRCRRLALPSGAVRRSVLVRRRFTGSGELVGCRRRSRPEYQRLRFGAFGGHVS